MLDEVNAVGWESILRHSIRSYNRVLRLKFDEVRECVFCQLHRPVLKCILRVIGTHGWVLTLYLSIGRVLDQLSFLVAFELLGQPLKTFLGTVNFDKKLLSWI